MNKQTFKGIKRNTRRYKAPPTQVHNKRKEDPVWEYQEWEPDTHCADCGTRLHPWMERFDTLAGDICERCFEAIVEA
jgi:hypothetical protein